MDPLAAQVFFSLQSCHILTRSAITLSGVTPVVGPFQFPTTIMEEEEEDGTAALLSNNAE